MFAIAGDNLGNNWPLCYKIIKGICEGLKYFQEGLEFPIFHLDLKPDNILLDEKIMPKISDFGLSRLTREYEKCVESSRDNVRLMLMRTEFIIS
jgi:serine/threonine protein kinase